MVIIILFNVIVFGFLFIKDPKLATAIVIGIVAALTVSGLISLADKLVKELKTR